MMTRVAVIGVGAMGQHHARVYHEMPQAELVAVVDQDRARAEQMGRQYEVPGYTDYCEMLDRERPDAVSVVVPTRAHYRVARDVLEAGSDVLVEKPIAETLADARALTRTAERAGRVLAVGHIERFNPAIIELKKRLLAGELGRIFQIHARRLGPFPRRVQDVGVVMDLATHDLDIMLYLNGNSVSRVFAETKKELHAHCEDLVVGILRFADTTLGFLEINWLTPTKIRELDITGERGMFRVNYLTQELRFFANAAAGDLNTPTPFPIQGVSQGPMEECAVEKVEPLRAELDAFIARVQGYASLIVDGHQAAAALDLAQRFAESAAWNGSASEEDDDEDDGDNDDGDNDNGRHPGVNGSDPSSLPSD